MKKSMLFSMIFPFIFLLLQFNSYEGDPVDHLVSKTATFIAKKYGLRKCGMGGGADKQGTWLVSIEFEHRGTPVDFAEGRRLGIEIAEEFLKVINENEAIRPYLKVYPFTSKNIDIGIYCYDYHGKHIFHPYVKTISVGNREIGFFTQDPDDIYKLVSKVYEPYEEALAKVRNGKDDNNPIPN